MRDNTTSPGNPLVVVHTEVVRGADGAPDRELGTALWIWCPGCEQAHRPRAALPDGSRPDPERPYWEWNGATDGTFTISPSLLCFHTVHLCPSDYEHSAVCPDPDGCGSSGHLILNDDWETTDRRVFGHMLPHVVEPAFGNCHSFIRDGVWDFLSDSAHRLAGQQVPMVPVPDWIRQWGDG